jgi:WhiB family redox-sensing transcriptional regulator
MMNAGGDLASSPDLLRIELPCRLTDPELFFAETPADVEQAKALCRDCPVQEMCLAGALERREPWGVWGGELFVAGIVVARKRPRGRPRKHPLADPCTEVAA